jgi:hypothetical protein
MLAYGRRWGEWILWVRVWWAAIRHHWSCMAIEVVRRERGHAWGIGWLRTPTPIMCAGGWVSSAIARILLLGVHA